MTIQKISLVLAAFTLLCFSLVSKAQLIVTKDRDNRTTIEHTYTEPQPFDLVYIVNNSLTGYIFQNEYVEFEIENLNDIDYLSLTSMGMNACTTEFLAPHESTNCKLAPAPNFYRNVRRDIFGLHSSKTDLESSELVINAKNHFKITYSDIQGVTNYTASGKTNGLKAKGLIGNNNIYVYEFAVDPELTLSAKQAKIVAHDYYAKGPDYTCELMLPMNTTGSYPRCP